MLQRTVRPRWSPWSLYRLCPAILDAASCDLDSIPSTTRWRPRGRYGELHTSHSLRGGRFFGRMVGPTRRLQWGSRVDIRYSPNPLLQQFILRSSGLWVFPPRPRSTRQPLTRSPNAGWKDYNTFEAFFVSSVWTSFSESIASLMSTALKTQYAAQFSHLVMTRISAWPKGLTSVYRIQFLPVLSLPERNSCETGVFSYAQCLHEHPSTSFLEVERFKGGATWWAIPMPIPGQKGEKNASENDGNILNSTFVILLSWKDAEVQKAGEAFTNSSLEERQPMIRSAGPGVINSHLKPDFLSEYNLQLEERSSVLFARYWDDVKRAWIKAWWTMLRVRTNTLKKPIFHRRPTIHLRPVSLRPTRMSQTWKRYLGVIHRREHPRRL